MAASNTGTTVYPGALDDYARVGTATFEDDTGYGHDDVHNQAQEAIEAIETTVGTTAGTGVLTNFVEDDLAARVNGESFGTPAITKGTATDFNLHNPTIGTPAISSGTATSLTLVTPATDTIAEKTAATGVTIDSLLIKDGQVGSWDGWMPADESWAYASATTITIPAGGAAKYAKGDKIKLTQTTVKYFSIVGVADTVLTITGGTSYTLTNAAITLNYYSHAVSPIGFPTWFTWAPTITWTAGTDPSGTPTEVEVFKIEGSSVTVSLFHYSYTAGATVTGASIPLPVSAAALSAVYCSINVGDVPNPTNGYLSGANAVMQCTSASADRIHLFVTYRY